MPCCAYCAYVDEADFLLAFLEAESKEYIGNGQYWAVIIHSLAAQMGLTGRDATHAALCKQRDVAEFQVQIRIALRRDPCMAS